MATAGIVPVAAPAAADDAGSIVVTVTSWASGDTASDGCVEAYSTSTTLAATQCVSAGGVYTISDLAPGTYGLQFTGFGGAGAPQWFDRATTYAKATGVDVAVGASTPVSYALLPGASVSGTVTGPTGAPLEGVLVRTNKTSGTDGTATTDADGRYVLENLAPSETAEIQFLPGAPLAQEVRRRRSRGRHHGVAAARRRT